MKQDVYGRGFGGFASDVLVLVGCIAMHGSGGCSLRKVHSFVYSSINNITVRAVSYKLKYLIDVGYVKKKRLGNRCVYCISSHAEKLIVKSLGRDELRNMARLVKDSMS